MICAACCGGVSACEGVPQSAGFVLVALVFRLPLGDNVVGGQAEDKVSAIGMRGKVALDLGKGGDVCPWVGVVCHVMVCAVGAHGMFAVYSMQSWE